MKTNLLPEDRDRIGVYMLHNAQTGEAYIGSGLLGRRREEHERRLNRGVHGNYRLQRAFDKNPNFEFVGVLIEDNGSRAEIRENALAIEQTLLDEFNGSSLLLNLATSVDKPTLGTKMSPENIEKLRQRVLGTKHTEESKRKIGEASALLWQDPQRREDRSRLLKQQYQEGTRSAPWLGKTMPPEVIEKLSRSHMKEVIADGVRYESVSAAATAFGIARSTAIERLRSDKFPSWRYGT
jgi:hypothetical protein